MMHREGARRGTGLPFPLKHDIYNDTGGRMISILTPYGTTSRLFAHGGGGNDSLHKGRENPITAMIVSFQELESVQNCGGRVGQ
jgi:hypothetical protein